jgi:hypothetical protein
MSGKRQRTTFAKNQREKARMEKAAAKRARRQARSHEREGVEGPADARDEHLMDTGPTTSDPSPPA